MKTSLHGFCRDHALPKSSVYNRCKELGIATSDGLTVEDCDRLRAEFDIEPPAVEPESEPIVTEPQPYRPTVEAGNHQIILASPELPETYSLEPLRSGEVVAFEDPLALAEQFIAAADAVQAAMDNDIAQRQQRLQRTEQARYAIDQRIQKLSLESRLYQLQSGQLDIQLTQETQTLSNSIQELQSLGKPQSEDAA